jgi:hypothetical protein
MIGEEGFELAKDREPQDEPKLFQGLVCLGIWLCP